MTYDRNDSLGSVFNDIMGQPAWQVKRGIGSFITMEFGKPSLQIQEPRASRSPSARVRDLLARRRVFIRGQWHLWIYCCEWRLTFGSRPAAHNESSHAVMDKALQRLDGQQLVSVELGPKGKSTFTFDLGAKLATWPAPVEAYSEDVESWLLYAPRGRVLSLLRDGSLTWDGASKPQAKRG